jgi:hypothetical protein
MRSLVFRARIQARNTMENCGKRHPSACSGDGGSGQHGAITAPEAAEPDPTAIIPQQNRSRLGKPSYVCHPII